MILQALVDYYEELAAQGKIAHPGWATVKVSWALEIDENGKLLDVLPLRCPSPDGKKMLPSEMELPAPVKRSSGILPNFLWDSSTYILGLDSKGKPKRAEECFEAAKELHVKLLASSNNPAAQAIIAFFLNWSPKEADKVQEAPAKEEKANEKENIIPNEL